AAIEDPHDFANLDALAQITGYRVLPRVAPELRIYYYIERYYGVPRPPRFTKFADAPRATEDVLDTGLPAPPLPGLPPGAAPPAGPPRGRPPRRAPRPAQSRGGAAGRWRGCSMTRRAPPSRWAPPSRPRRRRRPQRALPGRAPRPPRRSRSRSTCSPSS